MDAEIDKKIEEAIRRMEEARDKDKIAEYPYNRCIRILREVMKDGENGRYTHPKTIERN